MAFACGSVLRRIAPVVQRCVTSRIIGATQTSTRRSTLHTLHSNRNTIVRPCMRQNVQYFSSAATPQQAELYSDDTLESWKSPCQASDEENIRAVNELSTLNEADTRLLKIIKMEYDVMQSLGQKVPTETNDAMWLYLLKKCPTPGKRRKSFQLWWKLEVQTAADLKKKEKRLQRHFERKESEDKLREEGIWGPHKNTFLQRVENVTMFRNHLNNICHSMMNGPHLVFDFGFDNDDRIIKEVVKQILMAHGVGKFSTEPYHFHLCNVEAGGKIERKINELFRQALMVPFTVTDQHYLDIYPKKDLVYLSPNSRNELKSVDPNDVYIIGGIVDIYEELPLTFAKAKRENIRTAKLPLDRYLRWSSGSKALPLDIMVKILVTQKETGDWRQAFKHVPMRKAPR